MFGVPHAAHAPEAYERFEGARLALLLTLARFDEAVGRDFFEVAGNFTDSARLNRKGFSARDTDHGVLG